jgi:uncharacterized membrane protein HdeD (DUF308 family)
VAEIDTSMTDMRRVMLNALAAHWRMFLFQGIVMVILGVLAICAPMAATIAVDIYVGWLFLIGGVIGFVVLIASRHVHAFLWSLLTAALMVLIGGLLVARPAQGAVSLTIVLTAFFIVEGAFQSAVAISSRHVTDGHWGWLLMSGLADLALAAIIIAGWPGTAVWALGLLVGVNLLTTGWAIVMAALTGRATAHGAV